MHILLFDILQRGHHLKYAGGMAREMVQKGHEVSFVSQCYNELFSKYFPLDIPEFQLIQINEKYQPISSNRFVRYFQYKKALEFCMKILTAHKIHIFHDLSIARHEDLLFAFAKKIPGRVKLFGTIFSMYYKINEINNNLFKRLYHLWKFRHLEKLLTKGLMDGLFVHSGELLSFYQSEIPESNIYCVPDPIDIEDVPLTKIECRNVLDLPEDKNIFLFLGEMRYSRGPDIFLKTIKYLRDNSEICFVLAGKPDYVTQEDLKKYQEEIEQGKIIPRLSFIAEEDMPKYYIASDAVVLPYRNCFSGTSGILQHSIGYEIPVIATNCETIGKVVNENGLGLVIASPSPLELARGIEKFINDWNSLDHDFVKRAKKYSQMNSLNKMVTETLKIYEL